MFEHFSMFFCFLILCFIVLIFIDTYKLFFSYYLLFFVIIKSLIFISSNKIYQNVILKLKIFIKINGSSVSKKKKKYHKC